MVSTQNYDDLVSVELLYGPVLMTYYYSMVKRKV